MALSFVSQPFSLAYLGVKRAYGAMFLKYNEMKEWVRTENLATKFWSQSWKKATSMSLLFRLPIVQPTSETAELEKKVHELQNEVKKKDEKIKKMTDEKKMLFKIIKDQKQNSILSLQNEGQICAINCVLCAFIWICQKKLGEFLCGPQLVLIMSLHVGRRITRKNVMCGNLMDIFQKCNVIEEVLSYKFPENIDEKERMVNEVRRKLENIGEGVCILGASFEMGIGHVFVSYLEEGGTVKIYDPQNSRSKDFTEFIDDVNTNGLILSFINTGNLKRIIDEYSNILHRTNETYESFLERWFAISAP